MKKIAILSSGGDAPGMNACIRAIVRTALYYKREVVGITHGYDGLINGEFTQLKAQSVANIVQRGGTILKTARSKKFISENGMKKAYEQLIKKEINGLIVIGGDGTFRGADAFGTRFKLPIVGVPGTIDNDLAGTDYTIGYDTALNTVIEAVDKIRDTAESHERLFFVEVMGRDAGLIALRSGIGAGAEAILLPETRTSINELIQRLEGGRKDKSSKIIIVAEGDVAGGAFVLADKVKDALPFYDTRITILGHIQRGGAPSCMDRVNASRMGFSAVEALLKGKSGVMVGIKNNKIRYTPFNKAIKHNPDLDANLLRMLEILSM